MRVSNLKIVPVPESFFPKHTVQCAWYKASPKCTYCATCISFIDLYYNSNKYLTNWSSLFLPNLVQGLSTWKHHKKEISFNDDDDDESKKCMYFRYNHEKGQIDTMFCQFGCCGDLDDQKCCDDPEKDKDHNRYIFLFLTKMMVRIECI